jgi:beta-aspartyl-peptidase (threonine type)
LTSIMKENFSLAIHGGAGTILRSSMNPEKEAMYRSGLENALRIGSAILESGGKALDAVQAAVAELEDNPLFNAGRGSVFTHDGSHEMDASIMCGQTLMAGSVAGIDSVKNPVVLARTVMEKSEHVLLAGMQAVDFAKKNGIAIENKEYFDTEFRKNQWQEALAEDRVQLDHSDKKFGTVGAVACDRHGHLAAATSTGGMTNKRWGRVGDSPLIGCGNYANDKTCAVSCTGHGEFFIRAVVAYDLSCLMEYKGMSLSEAATYLVNDKLVKFGGEGGLIAVDGQGNIVLPFNSEGMYRGSIRNGEKPYTGIYGD